MAPVNVTFSEQEILLAYLPYWVNGMFLTDNDPTGYTIQDVIDDWVMINWAHETDEVGIPCEVHF